MSKIKRALISVSDKTGILSFAQELHALNVEILSTGGTANLLRNNNIPVIDVADYTGFPEMMDGRLKTLHPKVHGGLLAQRHNQEHMKSAADHEIGMIDMVVVNLYPFEQTIAKKGVALAEAIENIDIGGPTMLRSAAKNYQHVAVVCNPQRYDEVLAMLKQNQVQITNRLKALLAQEVFSHTACYDQMIADYLAKQFKTRQQDHVLPDHIQLRATKKQDLRYGENPHQQAAFYVNASSASGLGVLKQWHGKELSFNNILDLNAAIDVVKDFKKPAAVVIKHNNPTGVAESDTLVKAFKNAHACDPLSAFGGIIGLNQKVDLSTAKAISQSGFMECVIAPGFDADAKKVLMQKKNLRLVQVKLSTLKNDLYDVKAVYGGVLVQERDRKVLDRKDLTVVSQKKPTPKQIESLMFGWSTIKHVRSNAIILVKDSKTVGMGVGQTSRVDAAINAIRKAGDAAKGSLLISDAFLPMPDTVTIAAQAGIKAIIQTGGSIKDPEVIAEADKHGLIMLMTGCRHFKH